MAGFTIKDTAPLVWCEICKRYQPIRIGPARWSFIMESINVDIRCSACFGWISTLKLPEEGVYEFRKVADLPEVEARRGQAG